MQLPPTIISIGKDKKDREKKKLDQLPKSSTKTLNSPKDMPKSSSSDLEDSSGVSDEETMKTKKNSSLTKTSVLLPPRTLETTLFDRLEQMYGSSIKKMLDIQYRYVTTCVLRDGTLIPPYEACTLIYASSHLTRSTHPNSYHMNLSHPICCLIYQTLPLIQKKTQKRHSKCPSYSLIPLDASIMRDWMV